MKIKKQELVKQIKELEELIHEKKVALALMPDRGEPTELTVKFKATPEQYHQVRDFCRNIGGNAETTGRNIMDTLAYAIQRAIDSGRIDEPITTARWEFVDDRAVYFDKLYEKG